VQHWIATIQYAYVAPSKDEQLRSLNPLGFRILEYRREPEIVSEPAPSTTPTTTAGASS
jgi:type IV secretion system protein VirB8